MRAWIHRIGGSEVGSGDNFISGEYKTLRNLVKYAVPNTPGQGYRLAIHYSWSSRYGAPDKTIEVHNPTLEG